MYVSYLLILDFLLVNNRLFSYGIGIHLLQSEDPENMPKKGEINPKDNHISFQVFFPFRLRLL